jgi:Ser/Thr protein kinase RdoA (MazF antagonist)
MISDQTERAILDCLSRHYGIAGSLRRLMGENLNCLVTTQGGIRFVAKIVDQHMPPRVVEMKSRAIEHALQAGFPLNLPKIIKNKEGNIETGIKLHKKGSYRLHLLSFVEGDVLDDLSDISVNLLKNIGFSVAEFDLAVQDFEHPAAHRNHRWNLADTGRHKDKTELLEDPQKRLLLAWAFDAWAGVGPELEKLPRQLIHGDANPENILVKDDRVSGLVDFGDCCINPTVCDLAICLAYLMMGREDPLATAALVADAYHEHRPLSSRERIALFPLVCGRLATTIAISTGRRLVDPDNPNWFGTEQPAWELLRFLRDSSTQQI